MEIGDTIHSQSGSSANDRCQSTVEAIFDPFFHYVDSELRAQETLISPVDIGDTHRTSLESIIRSNWKFVNTVGHRRNRLQNGTHALLLSIHI